jgi:uncharacterized protein YodC (DUF2158 family)
MKPKYNVGDLVQLKSGGPGMTVTRVEEPYAGKITIDTTWFAGKKNESGRFPEDTLQPYDAAKAK